MKRELQIVDFETREIVKRVDVSGLTESAVERCMMGMLINMNDDKYFIDDVIDPQQPHVAAEGET